MGTGSEPRSMSTRLKILCASVPVPFFHGPQCRRPKKGTGTVGTTNRHCNVYRSTEPVPIFGLPRILQFSCPLDGGMQLSVDGGQQCGRMDGR